MLTPEYLDNCTDDLLGIYDALNTSIVQDISRRIAKTGKVTNTAKWQLKQVQESGKLLEEVTQDIAGITGFSNTHIQELFNDAGVSSIRYESQICLDAGLKPITINQSPAMMQILAASIDKTYGDVNNLTLTTAVASQNLYLEATNMAYMQITSGAFSYQEAIKQAIKYAAIQGGRVYYSNGSSSKLDTAIRRAVLTGVNQTAGKLTELYANEMGCDYYETSAHVGARNTGYGYYNHESWQGQVYCISGKDHKYRQFEEATGYGTGGGLCGYNCRHSFHMFFPGLSKPAYSGATLDRYREQKHTYRTPSGILVVLDEYECTQKQRAYERTIREQKAILAGYDAAIKDATSEVVENSLKEAFTEESVNLKRVEAELKDFCRQTRRDVDSARTQIHAVRDSSGKIVNFDKSISQKAVWANKKAQ